LAYTVGPLARRTTPTAAGDVALWIIVRDERGGVGWASRRLRVR
jgi:hypothetical protein